MASYTQIVEEIPSWTIDWVNTVFTIVNTPVTNWLTLFLNWLAQTSWVDYALVGTTITFVSAPPLLSNILAKIIVTIEVTPTSDSLLTLWDVITRIYTKMWIKSDSTIFDKNNIVLPKLNRVISDICAWQVTNIINPNITYKAGFLRFLAKKYFFTTKSPAKLTASTTWGTISFDTTDFDSSGYVIINEDIIQYTGKTATSITGFSWLSTNHDSASIVEQVYELPTTAWKNFNLWNLKNKTYPIKFIDDRWQKDFEPYWTLKYDSTSDKEFIYVKWLVSNFLFDYYAKSINLTDDTDVSILPDSFMEWIAIPLTAWLLLYSQYWEDILGKRWQWLIQDWYHSLQSLYWQKAERVKEFRKIVKRPSWGHRNTVSTCDND